VMFTRRATDNHQAGEEQQRPSAEMRHEGSFF